MAQAKTADESKPLSVDKIVGLPSPEDFDLSRDGKHLAFTLDLGPHRQIFSLEVMAGWPRRLTAELKEFKSPRWSPDGQRFAYVLDKGIWVMDGDGSNAKRLTEHGAGNSQPRWAPDGMRIVFYSRRRGWSHIWMMNSTGGETVQLTRSSHDNSDLEWSPDGRHIAYASIRTDDLLNRDLFVVSTDDAKETRLTESNGSLKGSPAWSPDGRSIAFVSDADAWFHIYLLDVASRKIEQLTAGSFEDAGRGFVTEGGPFWSPDGKSIAFTRNREGKYDVFVYEFATNQSKRVSKRDGVYSLVGWLPDSKALVVTFSSPVESIEAYLFSVEDGSEKQITQFSPGGFHKVDLTVPERVQYKARDGLDINGYLYKPRNMQSGKHYPALIYPHGGPTTQFSYGWQPTLQLLSQEGYAILAPDFRGSYGYGKKFRMANFNEWGNKDTFDVVDGAEFLKKQGFVDPNKIGIFGGSYGGYMVLCALARAPEVFKVGVDLYGDSEIAESYRHGDRPGRLDLKRQMGTPEQNPDAYKRGSPVYFAENIQAPLLIIHGKDDMRVVPLMSEKLIEALKIEGKFFESKFYDSEAHGIRKPENRKDMLERILSFLKKYLKEELEEKPAPS